VHPLYGRADNVTATAIVQTRFPDFQKQAFDALDILLQKTICFLVITALPGIAASLANFNRRRCCDMGCGFTGDVWNLVIWKCLIFSSAVELNPVLNCRILATTDLLGELLNFSHTFVQGEF